MLHASQAGFDRDSVCFYPEITDSLRIIAGENALELARLFPSPSSDFLNQPRQVMHLTGLALATRTAQTDKRFLDLKWKSQLKEAMPDRWHGNQKIFSKIPLPMWAGEQYKKLFDLLNCPAAKKFLQHDNIITANTIEILHELPVALRVPAVVKFLSNSKEAQIIALLCSDSKTASCFLDKVRDMPSRKDFWDDGTTYLIARAFEFPLGPNIDHPNIHQIGNAVALIRFAGTFRNCLRGYVGEGIGGEMAFYHYSGREPAVISLKCRFGGQPTIDEIKGVGNAEVSEETRKIITDAFANHGILDVTDDIFSGVYQQLLRSFSSIGRNDPAGQAFGKDVDAAIKLIEMMATPSAAEEVQP
jgi:hypothetical protein